MVADNDRVRTNFFGLFSRYGDFTRRKNQLRLLVIAINCPFSQPIKQLRFNDLRDDHFQDLTGISVLVPCHRVPVMANVQFRYRVANVQLRIVQQNPSASFQAKDRRILLASFMFPDRAKAFHVRASQFTRMFYSRIRQGHGLIFAFTARRQRRNG